jgi:hypothetical protein
MNTDTLTRSFGRRIAAFAFVGSAACIAAFATADPPTATPSTPAVATSFQLPPANEDGWIPLFNGKNLDGWVYKETGSELGADPKGTVKVEDGILKFDYSGWDEFKGRFGHLHHVVPFDRYRMRIVYRFVGDQVTGGPGWAYRNSGIMVHGQDPASMRKDQDFPVSIEVQLLGGGGQGERPTGNLCTPGTNVEFDEKLVTRHCTNSTSATYHGDQWVSAEIEVLGNDEIVHYVEGKEVLRYQRPQLDPNDADAKMLMQQRNGDVMLGGGWISLQGESHPVEFKLVEIKPLPAKETAKPE